MAAMPLRPGVEYRNAEGFSLQIRRDSGLTVDNGAPHAPITRIADGSGEDCRAGHFVGVPGLAGYQLQGRVGTQHRGQQVDLAVSKACT